MGNPCYDCPEHDMKTRTKGCEPCVRYGPDPSMTLEKELLAHCQRFIHDQGIFCSENVYQSDRVIENAYEFIAKICGIVGYVPAPDEDDDDY